MAGNKKVTDLAPVPVPQNSLLYVAKDDENYNVQVGVANGLAYLDASTKIPLSHIPTDVATDAEVTTAVSTKASLTGADFTGPTSNYVGPAATQTTLHTYGRNNVVGRWKWVLEADDTLSLWSYNTAGASANRALNIGTGVAGTSTLTFSGNVVWHAGNFDPATKAAASHTHTAANITDLASYTGLDARYYTETEVNNLLTGKAAASHTHGTADITNLASYTGLDGRYYTKSAVDAGLNLKANLNADVDFRDVKVSRGDGTGVIFLNASGTRYLYYDGTNYILPGSQLLINGGTAWHGGNLNPASYAPLAGATFTGTVYAPGFQISSSRTIKHNIMTAYQGLEEVMELRPVSFHYKYHDDGIRLGLIAEEVQEVLPSAVRENEAGIPSIDYNQLVPVLISAIQTLEERIRVLEEGE